MTKAKQVLLDTGFLIFVFCILPVFSLLLMMAVGLTFGRLEKLNEFTIRISLATIALILVIPVIDNNREVELWLKE